LRDAPKLGRRVFFAQKVTRKRLIGLFSLNYSSSIARLYRILLPV